MGQLSDSNANTGLDAAVPTTLYVGLSSTTPTATGTNVTEPSGNGYARAAVTMGAASGRNKANTTAAAFAASGGDWGTMTHAVFYTALTGGTFVGFDDLIAARNMVDGASIDIPIGDIDFNG